MGNFSFCCVYTRLLLLRQWLLLRDLGHPGALSNLNQLRAKMCDSSSDYRVSLVARQKPITCSTLEIVNYLLFTSFC